MDKPCKKFCDFFSVQDYELKIITNDQFTRSITEEILTPLEAKFNAKIPEWLNGKLTCNGPGKFNVGDHQLNHLYDGLAVLQQFHIQSDGKVTYKNKFIQSEAHARGCRENRILYSEFGTKPTSHQSNGVVNKFLQMIKVEVTDNTSVNINSINNEFYAATDSSKIIKIDIDSLDTIERVDLGDKFKIMGNTSHVHVTKDKTVYSLGTSVSMSGASYNIIEFLKAGKGLEKAKIVAKMNASMKLHPSSMHSFGMTENFFIIIESPLKISLPTALKGGVVPLSFFDCVKWHSGETTKIHLLNRSSGKLQQTFQADPFFFFHTANSYEKEDQVILDIICYLNYDVTDVYWFDKLSKDDSDRLKKSHSNVMRFVMPLKTSNKDKNENLIKLENTSASAHLVGDKIHCIPEVICDFGCEHPRFNYEMCAGIEYKFLYTNARNGGFIKINLETKEKIHWMEEDIIIFDPLFIPSPNGKEEDDGIILTGFFRNKVSNCTGILVFDAKNLDEIARCEFRDLPSPIPKPFHTIFISNN